MLWQNWVSTPEKQENSDSKKKLCTVAAFHWPKRSSKDTFGTTLNIGTRLLVAHSSCVSKGDWDRDVWKRLNAIFRAGSVTRCNNGWHRPVGTAEYNPAKGSTGQLGWGMWLRAFPPSNNKSIYINRNLTKKWFPVRMEDVPMTQTSVKPKEPLR